MTSTCAEDISLSPLLMYLRELSKAAADHIKQEDEGKFRCKNCQKLFKAATFVEKHIANKHPELVKAAMQDVSAFLNGCPGY